MKKRIFGGNLLLGENNESIKIGPRFIPVNSKLFKNLH